MQHVTVGFVFSLLHLMLLSWLCRSYNGAEDGRPFVFVSSIWDNRPRSLAAGDELFISYMASTPPLTAFLNLGFVPEELLS